MGAWKSVFELKLKSKEKQDILNPSLHVFPRSQLCGLHDCISETFPFLIHCSARLVYLNPNILCYVKHCRTNQELSTETPAPKQDAVPSRYLLTFLQAVLHHPGEGLS